MQDETPAVNADVNIDDVKPEAPPQGTMQDTPKDMRQSTLDQGDRAPVAEADVPSLAIPIDRTKPYLGLPPLEEISGDQLSYMTQEQKDALSQRIADQAMARAQLKPFQGVTGQVLPMPSMPTPAPTGQPQTQPQTTSQAQASADAELMEQTFAGGIEYGGRENTKLFGFVVEHKAANDPENITRYYCNELLKEQREWYMQQYKQLTRETNELQKQSRALQARREKANRDARNSNVRSKAYKKQELPGVQDPQDDGLEEHLLDMSQAIGEKMAELMAQVIELSVVAWENDKWTFTPPCTTEYRAKMNRVPTVTIGEKILTRSISGRDADDFLDK